MDLYEGMIRTQHNDHILQIYLLAQEKHLRDTKEINQKASGFASAVLP